MKVSSALVLILLSLSLISLISSATISIVGGGGGGVTGSIVTLSYTTPAVSSTKQEVYNGETLESTATWYDTGYLAVEGTNLQILPDEEYTLNNGSFVISNLASIAINITFEIGSGSSPYGQFIIGYGVNIGPNMMVPHIYGDEGIVVFVTHADMEDEHLMAYYNDVLVLNVTVNDLTTGTVYGMGFVYGSDYTLTVYWYNGTVYSWTTAETELTSSGTKNVPLSTNGDYFVVGASNAGPVFGYSQWEIVDYFVYQNVETTPPMKLTLSYYGTSLSNGVKALIAYVGADNPVNISTNASSWSITAEDSITNYSVSGSTYPLSGSFSYVTSSEQIFLITDSYPTSSISDWYVNETYTIQLISASSSYSIEVTIPVLIVGFAEDVHISYPTGSYLSGSVISFSNLTYSNLPSNLGYSVAQPIVSEVEIEGVTNGYVPLPYSNTFSVSVTTTYNYYVMVSEGGIVISILSESFTVYPIQSYPVIFAVAPSSAQFGSYVTIQFEFTENAPISNVTSLANNGGLLKFSYWQIKSSTVEMILDLSQTKYGALVFIPSAGSNFYVWFNGSSGLAFSTGANLLTLSVTSTGVTDLSLGGVSITIDNTSQLIGIGIYNSTFNWLYVDGAVLQNAYADQSYVISIGNSTATLTQYTSGYTNASGWGVVSVPIKYSPYELINIYWYGVKNVLLNITVTTPTTSTSTIVNTSTLNYNYTQPFSNNIKPNSTLYNFNNDQPWAFLVGIAIIVILALLGWKFGNVAGASGGSIAGIIASAYLGLVPWYIYFIIIMIIAMVLAKLIVDKFMSGDEL